jgi:hypothetical protein
MELSRSMLQNNGMQLTSGGSMRASRASLMRRLQLIPGCSADLTGPHTWRVVTMAKHQKPAAVMARWMAIPDQLRRVVRGLSHASLDSRAGPEAMSIRETVHHLVEANLVASNIIIAALAKSGIAYDWTWVTPNALWMKRLGYDRAPVAPAMSTLAALSRHLGALLSVSTDGLQRTVQLQDAPGAARYTKTVGQILGDEVDHAREHLEALPPRRVRRTGLRGRRTRG